MADVLVDVASLVEVPDEHHAVIGSSRHLFANSRQPYHCGWKLIAFISSLCPLNVRSSLGSSCSFIIYTI